MISVYALLALSTLLFFIGVVGFITRRNLIAMLISIELVLNSVDINFAVFNRMLHPNNAEGFFFTLFSMGIAIIINVYHNLKNDQVNGIENMKF